VDLFIGIAHLLDFHNFSLGLMDLEIDRSVINLNLSGICILFVMGYAEGVFILVRAASF
jgi:hypothetical protein